MSIDVAMSQPSAEPGVLQWTLQQALTAHSDLKRQLAAAVSAGHSGVSVDVASADNRCAFGHWLYGEIPWRLRKSWDFANVRKRHAEFHLQAGRVLELAVQGRAAAATDAMFIGTPFDDAYEQLERALRDWIPRIEGQASGAPL